MTTGHLIDENDRCVAVACRKCVEEQHLPQNQVFRTSPDSTWQELPPPASPDDNTHLPGCI